MMWRRVVSTVLAMVVAWGMWGCAKPTDPQPLLQEPTAEPNRLTGQLQEVAPPTTLQTLKQVIDTYTPQVRILSPRPGEVLETTTAAVRFQVRGLPLFKDDASGMGPHLHVFLDDQPYQAVYDLSQPLIFSDLSPGTHTLRVFASRPWHESFKNEGAFAERTFHIFAKTPQTGLDKNQPLLTYSRPQGSYGAEPIMLDFYLTNAPLHMIAQEDGRDPVHDWRVRATINGESFVFDQWQPVYLTGFKPGQNWVQLELIDENGDPIENQFNNTVRVITYEPGGEDSLSRLVRGELALQQALGMIDPNYVPPVEPAVEPSEAEEVPLPEPTPEPETVPDTDATAADADTGTAPPPEEQPSAGSPGEEPAVDEQFPTGDQPEMPAPEASPAVEAPAVAPEPPAEPEVTAPPEEPSAVTTPDAEDSDRSAPPSETAPTVEDLGEAKEMPPADQSDQVELESPPANAKSDSAAPVLPTPPAPAPGSDQAEPQIPALDGSEVGSPDLDSPDEDILLDKDLEAAPSDSEPSDSEDLPQTPQPNPALPETSPAAPEASDRSFTPKKLWRRFQQWRQPGASEAPLAPTTPEVAPDADGASPEPLPDLEAPDLEAGDDSDRFTSIPEIVEPRITAPSWESPPDTSEPEPIPDAEAPKTATGKKDDLGDLDQETKPSADDTPAESPDRPAAPLEQPVI